MRLKTGVITLFCTLLAHAAVAEELPSIFGEQSVQIWPMAGSSLANGKEGRTSLEETARQKGSFGGGEKSPGRALLLSAILPGAGEFYAGSKKKAAVFFGIEAITVGLYFSWKGKGDDIEKEFRAVADAHWTSDIYLAWRGTTKAIRNNSFTHAMPCSLEASIGSGNLGECDSSELQQYYELLGKYYQFVVGWEDMSFTTQSPDYDYQDVLVELSGVKPLGWEDSPTGGGGIGGSFAVVPEPFTVMLLGTVAFGTIVYQRRSLNAGA